MTNRYRFLIVPLLAACPAILPAKTHVAERFDVLVTVRPDATLRVVESIRFIFHGGNYTYVSRELAKRRLDRIDGIRAEMDGAPAAVEIEQSSTRVKVRWTFDAAAESTHEFRLSYDVQGAIRRDAASGRLVWNAIPERHDYEIDAGRIEIQYPAADAVSQPAAARAIGVMRQTGRSVFSLPLLRKNRGAAVSIDFRPGFVVEPPRWQAADDERGRRRRTVTSTGMLAAFVALLIGGFDLARRRASVAPNHAVPVLTMSPAAAQSIPPAVAGRLAAGSSLHGALATLFDLASRGVVSIREAERGRFGSRSYRIDRRAHSGPLLPFESAVLDLALRADPPTITAFISRLSSSGGQFAAGLEDHLLARGLLSRDRLETRRHWMVTAGLLALGGAGVLAGGLLAANAAASALPALGAVAGVGAAALVLGLAGLIAASTISPLSREGALGAAQARAMRDALAAMVRNSAADPHDFERWLPAAIAFGLGARWIKRFRDRGVPLPAWFQAGSDADAYVFYDFVTAAGASADSAASGAGGDGGSGGGSSSAG